MAHCICLRYACYSISIDGKFSPDVLTRSLLKFKMHNPVVIYTCCYLLLHLHSYYFPTLYFVSSPKCHHTPLFTPPFKCMIHLNMVIKSPQIRRWVENRRSCLRSASYWTSQSPFTNFRPSFCTFSSTSASRHRMGWVAWIEYSRICRPFLFGRCWVPFVDRNVNSSVAGLFLWKITPRFCVKSSSVEVSSR